MMKNKRINCFNLNNKNYKSSISDEIKDLYEFGLNELKLFNYTSKVEISSIVDIFNDEYIKKVAKLRNQKLSI